MSHIGEGEGAAAPITDSSEFHDVPLDKSAGDDDTAACVPESASVTDGNGLQSNPIQKRGGEEEDNDDDEEDDEADEKYESEDDDNNIISDEEVGGSKSRASKRESISNREGGEGEGGDKILPDPQTQRTIIKDLELSISMEVGQTWYLIAIQWWRQWREYVQWDSRFVYHRNTHPGPIDNSFLFEPGTTNLGRMKMDTFDYYLANERMWNQLVEWYGGGPPIARKVISYGIYTTSKTVEVYPQVLSFYFRATPTQGLPSIFIFISIFISIFIKSSSSLHQVFIFIFIKSSFLILIVAFSDKCRAIERKRSVSGELQQVKHAGRRQKVSVRKV